jgi:uncharacterized membrane protein
MSNFTHIISITGYALEAVGVIIIVIGAIRATVHAASRFSTGAKEDLYREFRREIGRAMILGLEFLVAGDIIRTVVVAHSIVDIASLGLLVLIRTVLVFTIHLDVEGHWPWQATDGSGTAATGGDN